MAINKSHAIILLAAYVGQADGEWSEEEMVSAYKYGALKGALSEGADWKKKIESGELTIETAITLLKSSSKEDRLKCLHTCLSTAMSDGELHPKEKEIITNLVVIFGDISFDELFKGHIEKIKETSENHSNLITNKITGENIENPFPFKVADNDLDGYMSFSSALKNIETMGNGWRLPFPDEIELMIKYKQVIGLKKKTYWTGALNGGLAFSRSLVWYNPSRFIIKSSACGVRLVKDL